MKFRLFTLPCTLLVLTALVFTACSKEGPVGPAGATGPQGPTGPTGPQGPAGTANVYYSDWLDVTFAPQVNGTDTTGWVAEIPAPRLVDSILARGAVQVYLNIGTDAEPTVVPLPLDAPLFQIILSPFFGVGKISLLASGDLSSFTDTDNHKNLQYRYIIIPGGASAAQGVTGSNTKINWNNYDEVKTHLHLRN